MSSEIAVPKKKLPLVKICVVLLVIAVGAFFVLRGVNIRELFERAMEYVRGAGPTVFFTAMALLPALGMPVSAFTLTAGSAFGDRLGMPVVVALSLLALTINMVLSYALARRALRPVLEWMVKKLGYSLPNVEKGDLTDLTIVLRVTPGTPFFIQNYLLGLAGVPFWTYVIVSCIVMWIYTAAFVLFGDALIQGKGKMAFFAFGLFVVAIVLTQWLRKRYAKKKSVS